MKFVINNIRKFIIIELKKEITNVILKMIGIWRMECELIEAL